MESIIPVPVEENNPPPSYDAAVKKNNYFPEVLKHQKKPTTMATDIPKNKKTKETELSFLRLVNTFSYFISYDKKSKNLIQKYDRNRNIKTFVLKIFKNAIVMKLF